MKRTIRYIVLHCTATDIDVELSSIRRYWKEVLGWKNPGYHFIIDSGGGITQLQPLEKSSNGVRGYNANSVHVCYIGGVDQHKRPKDTRTYAQYIAMTGLVNALQAAYPEALVKGHRDFPNVTKACPSFDVSNYLREIRLSR